MFAQARTTSSGFLAGSFVLISIYSLFISCESEPVDDSLLEGKWNVYAATRSGRTTETLKDAYFTFVSDTLLRSNILREEEDFRYVVKGDRIETSGPIDIVYGIDYISQDTLFLSSTIKGYQFEFFTIRDTIETSVPPVQ